MDLLISDLEGELFFGAAPELDRYFDEITERTKRESIRYVVLRVKRTRNPDVVFLERLEHFLRQAEAHGVTILLAGVRPDFAQGLSNLAFGQWLPSDRVFCEDDEVYSATLKAVRYAHHLMGKRSPNEAKRREASEGESGELYYLV